MPQWTNEPPQEARQSAFRLIRTPAASALTGCVISHNLLGCRTHFIGNRTTPCEQPICDICLGGIGWRWHGYLLVLLVPSQESVIFECTAITAQAFVAYRERYNTLRGAAFKAQRHNARSNGRVLIQIKPADLERIRLPKDKDLIRLLSHIWNIPFNQTVEPDHQTRPPARDVVVDRSLPELPILPLKPSEEQRDFVHGIAQKKKKGSNGRREYPDTFPDPDHKAV